MKGFERMKEMNHGLHGLCSLTLAIWGLSAVAATGTSGEFRMDLSGMGPWEMRTARASEAISYSTAWVTNLTVAQQASANAVMKVYPAKREKPKYIAIDLSGDTAVICLPRSPVGARLWSASLVRAVWASSMISRLALRTVRFTSSTAL